MPFEASAVTIASVLPGAELHGDGTVTCRDTTTDSREVKPAMLFVARRGETADGHSFIGRALESGAAACLVAKQWVSSAEARPFLADVSAPSAFIAVDDPTVAFGQLAHHWRMQLDLPTAAITGSNGKTTTKEITRSLLERLVGPGTANIKSFNNNIGLPQTILRAGRESKWLLLEAGMNHPGELDALGAIAAPDVAAVLNVGPAHIGFFRTLDRIADAKCELLAHVRKRAVICADDPELVKAVARLEERLHRALPQTTFAVERAADITAEAVEDRGLEGLRFVLHHKQQKAPTAIPHVGRHNVYNALAGAAVVCELFPDLKLVEIAAALADVERPPMRLEILPFRFGTIINDAYNANPGSMRAAVITASNLGGGEGFAAIIGDMLELGDLSEQLHHELGANLGASGAVAVVAVGTYAPVVVQAAVAAGVGEALVAKTAEEAAQIYLGFAAKPRVLLVKGSRGMALERAVQALLDQPSNI